MKILWMTWKDASHPAAGGAEVVNEELVKRLVADGHEVTFVVGGYPGGKAREERRGYTVIRLGNRYTLYWLAYRYYKKHLSNWPDYIIEEVNTMPFFARFYAKQPILLFVDQLCRQIWFYQLAFPFSLIGYLIEPIYLWFLRASQVVTISDSSKRDLLRYGFSPDKISIIPVGIEIAPLSTLSSVQKYRQPTVLSLGAARPMKRTLDQVKAFELAKQKIPELQLKIAGSTSGRYGRELLDYIQTSPFAADIEHLGRVDDNLRLKVMQQSHVILVTSVKEGWGLIVTEAASQGTPAIVYDVDGLRDSVKHNLTGLVCTRNTPADLAHHTTLLLTKHEWYTTLQEHAWQWSKEITFDRSYQQFKQIIKNDETTLSISYRTNKE